MILDAALGQRLADALEGRLTDGGNGPAHFEHLLTDTRKLNAGGHGSERTVFIALRGPRHDGHDHVAQAAEGGVKGFILALDADIPDPEGWVLRVPDTLLALQMLGAEARSSRAGRVVGITGSNGKTTVKEWAHALTGPEVHVSRSPGSWNSQMGVPLALWGLDDHADWHLVEAGISMPGEMASLESMIRPDIGVLVHFGDAHDAHFPDRHAKAREKATLFKGCGTIILGTQDTDMLAALKEAGLSDRCTGWRMPGRTGETTLGSTPLEIHACVTRDGHARLTGTWRQHPFEWNLPFDDPALIHNALTSALLILEMTGDLAGIGQRIAALRPVGMRLEHLRGNGGGTIINDTWNHDLDGLASALEALERLTDQRNRAVVMSDLVPYDPGNVDLVERLRLMVGHRKVHRWILVGNQWSEGIPGVSEGAVLHFPDTDTLLDSTALDDLGGWNVLVKGARPFRFERVARALESNPHMTVLDLDLGRLARNFEAHRDRWGVPVMGMVKAFAYGAGDTIALELDRLGISHLAVAFIEEGIRLRQQGVSCPILVLNAETGRHTELLEWRLEPEIHDLESIEAWSRASRTGGHTGHASGVHLKVETGMHRLGLGREEWRKAGAKCARHGVEILSVYSHLSAADDPLADDHTRRQLEAHAEACTAIREGWASVSADGAEPDFIRHIANTAGAARFPEARMDMVRIGIGLYGLDPSGTLKGLQPIGRFHTRVSHVHDVPAGTPVGYGARDVADHARTIATLPVGYADGLPRQAGMGRATLYAAGAACPTVGPVCMDSCMIDISGTGIERGDAVEIFGDHAPMEALAAATGSIPYELLCRIPSRVRRRYLRT